MSNFDKLFGRTYSTVGNSDSDFIIKNNGNMENLFDVAKEVSDKIRDYYNNKYNC